MQPFSAVLGEAAAGDKLLTAMPAFFTKLVELDPDILLERPKLDIPLRESLRVVQDWIHFDSSVDPAREASSIAAAMTPPAEKDPVPPKPATTTR
jgi:hypothetical protein